MSHKITLVLGDWSHDGHGLTDRVTVETNYTPAKIKKAYAAGTALIGVDLSKDICHDYEDHQLTEDHYNLFKKSGLLQDTYDDSWVDSDTYARLYLWVCKQGDPDFAYKIVPDSTASINIGGYGLFE